MCYRKGRTGGGFVPPVGVYPKHCSSNSAARPSIVTICNSRIVIPSPYNRYTSASIWESVASLVWWVLGFFLTPNAGDGIHLRAINEYPSAGSGSLRTGKRKNELVCWYLFPDNRQEKIDRYQGRYLIT